MVKPSTYRERGTDASSSVFIYVLSSGEERSDWEKDSHQQGGRENAKMAAHPTDCVFLGSKFSRL
jgi:hypothetical protein